MKTDYDVIVLGGGSPGEHCAGVLADGGLRVAVVERDLVGGECSYWACIPSKTLLRPGEAVHAARDAAAAAELLVDQALAWREVATRLLPNEPPRLGEALGEVLRRDGIDLVFGVRTTAASRKGADYVLSLDDGQELRGDHLLVASNILGERREAHFEAVPRVVFTEPQAASIGAAQDLFVATVPLSATARTATYTRAYADSNGFLALVSDGECLTGACALGPEAGEWMQQANLAIRARIPLEMLRDTIQPFPTFAEIYVPALHELTRQITEAGQPIEMRSR